MIKISCVVENTSLPDSPFRSEHGVSFHIETPHGKVLFDVGETADLFLDNARQHGIDLMQVDAIAVSHAHYDHTGGLAGVLDHTRPGLPFYAHPDLFTERFTIREGKHESIGMRLPRPELENKVDVRWSAEPVEIVPGVWTTGEIKDRSEFEGRSPSHSIQVDGDYQPDPYRDDMSLVLEAENGLVVVCGCCHAGLLNTLKQVKAQFEGDIIAVMGGTHLMSATDDMLQQAVDELRDVYGVPRLYPNHCSGKKAYTALVSAFGDKVQPCPAGTVLTF